MTSLAYRTASRRASWIVGNSIPSSSSFSSPFTWLKKYRIVLPGYRKSPRGLLAAGIRWQAATVTAERSFGRKVPFDPARGRRGRDHALPWGRRAPGFGSRAGHRVSDVINRASLRFDLSEQARGAQCVLDSLGDL